MIDRAVILSTGDELTTGRVVDTNSAAIADRLSALGVEVAAVLKVGDDREKLLWAFGQARELGDLTIGTGALLVQDGGLETPLEYHSVPIFELRPLEGPSGTIETVFRLRKPKLGNLLQIWPQAKLPPELEQKIEARPNETVEIIEGVVHRPFFRDYVYVVLHRGAASSEHASVMLATQMDLSPFIVFRWSKLAGETWGRGPLFDVLGDVRTCNLSTQFGARALPGLTTPIR